jgi:hypothetical protein
MNQIDKLTEEVGILKARIQNLERAVEISGRTTFAPSEMTNFQLLCEMMPGARGAIERYMSERSAWWIAFRERMNRQEGFHWFENGD